MNKQLMAVLVGLPLLATGCVTHQASMSNNGAGSDKTLTAGVVQKEIRKGMSADEVAVALGSPNIVTTGADGNQVWIYDRISSTVSQKSSSAYGTLLLIGGSTSSASRQSSQSTFTVVIKYDANDVVRDLAYHTSRF